MLNFLSSRETLYFIPKAEQRARRRSWCHFESCAQQSANHEAPHEQVLTKLAVSPPQRARRHLEEDADGHTNGFFAISLAVLLDHIDGHRIDRNGCIDLHDPPRPAEQSKL